MDAGVAVTTHTKTSSCAAHAPAYSLDAPREGTGLVEHGRDRRHGSQSVRGMIN